MQRDIKFRAWHEQDKEMVYFKNEKLVNDQHQMQHLAHLINGDYGDVLMQFTGLKGKNGVDIYEGDIIEDHIGRGVVVWWVRNAAFKVSYIGENSGKGKWFADYLDSEYKTIKVIGNIYENPELLKSPD